MQAKLDTGADHSSVHAHISKRQQKAGQDWITFEISNKAGAKAVFETPVHRIAKIRRHSGKVQERPVVYMEICLGPFRRKVEVNLVDRKNLTYKILIGRSFLANYGVVDSSITFTSSPNCG